MVQEAIKHNIVQHRPWRGQSFSSLSPVFLFLPSVPLTSPFPPLFPKPVLGNDPYQSFIPLCVLVSPEIAESCYVYPESLSLIVEWKEFQVSNHNSKFKFSSSSHTEVWKNNFSLEGGQFLAGSLPRLQRWPVFVFPSLWSHPQRRRYEAEVSRTNSTERFLTCC